MLYSGPNRPRLSVHGAVVALPRRPELDTLAQHPPLLPQKALEGPTCDLDGPLPGAPLVDQVRADEADIRRASAYALQCVPPSHLMNAAQGARIAGLQRALGADRYDAAAWRALLGELKDLGGKGPARAEEAREAYKAGLEEALLTFPAAGELWTQLAEAEAASGNINGAKGVFARCLMHCLHVGLYRTYVRIIKQSQEGRGGDGLVQVRKVLEFACDRVGQAPDSGPLWEEYVAFLRDVAPGTPEHKKLFAVPGQEEAAQREAVRKAYRRALGVPHGSLDGMWREYERWEQGASASADMSKKMVDEQKPVVNLCRMLHAERSRVYGGMPSDALAVLPGREGPGVVPACRAVLALERANKQRLEGPALVSRVSLAFETVLGKLYRHPEVWYGYVCWHMSADGGGEGPAMAVLARATIACPGCLALKLLRAQILEKGGKLEEAKAVYEDLMRGAGGASTGRLAGVGTRGAVAVHAASGALTTEGAGEAFVQYLHFVRRHEGMSGARKLFVERAVKGWETCPWTVYAAAALMEWGHDRNTKFVRNVFELGAKRHLGEPGFVEQYVKWLLGQGDDTNARNVCERALDACPPEARPGMWDVRMRLEVELGNTDLLVDLEAKRSESLSGDWSVDPDLDRYACLVMRYHRFNVFPGSSVQRVHFRRLTGLVQGGAGAPAAGAGEGATAVGPARGPEPGGGRAGRAEGRGREPPQRASVERDTVGGPVGVLLSLLPPAAAYEGCVPDPEAVLDMIDNAAIRPSWPGRKREAEGDGSERRQRPRFG